MYRPQNWLARWRLVTGNGPYERPPCECEPLPVVPPNRCCYIETRYPLRKIVERSPYKPPHSPAGRRVVLTLECGHELDVWYAYGAPARKRCSACYWDARA